MDVEQIATLTLDLNQQLALYRELIVLNQEQFEILDQGVGADTDSMVTFIGRKQNSMQRLESLDAKIAPQKQWWSEAKMQVGADAAVQVEALLAEISQTIEELIVMEDEAQRRLESLMVVNTSSAENIRKKSQLNKAYAAYGAKTPKPRYIDRRADDR